MNKFLGMTIAAAFLAACADKEEVVVDPTNEVVDIELEGEDDDSTISIVDGTITVGDLVAAQYNGTDLLVQIRGLDGADVTQQFTVVSGDRGDGFDEFEIQISGLNRDYAAFAKTSEEGGLKAVVVMDGGQFNRSFGGATLQQISFSSPESGTASYLGNYIGLINGGSIPDEAPPVDADPVLYPAGPSEVTGTVFLNANFADNQIEGAIYDRATTFNGTVYSLAEVILTVGDVNPDGTFVAVAERPDERSVGAYSGAFGGANAASVGGVINLTGDFLVDPALISIFGEDSDVDTGNAVEYGIFVVGTCGPLGGDCFPGE